MEEQNIAWPVVDHTSNLVPDVREVEEEQERDGRAEERRGCVIYLKCTAVHGSMLY